MHVYVMMEACRITMSGLETCFAIFLLLWHIKNRGAASCILLQHFDMRSISPCTMFCSTACYYRFLFFGASWLQKMSHLTAFVSSCYRPKMHIWRECRLSFAWLKYKLIRLKNPQLLWNRSLANYCIQCIKGWSCRSRFRQTSLSLSLILLVEKKKRGHHSIALQCVCLPVACTLKFQQCRTNTMLRWSNDLEISHSFLEIDAQ